MCDNQTHVNNIKERALKAISKKEFSNVYFITSNQFPTLLDELEPKNFTTQKRIKGYRVKTNYNATPDTQDKQKSIASILLKSIQKKK